MRDNYRHKEKFMTTATHDVIILMTIIYSLLLLIFFFPLSNVALLRTLNCTLLFQTRDVFGYINTGQNYESCLLAQKHKPFSVLL